MLSTGDGQGRFSASAPKAALTTGANRGCLDKIYISTQKGDQK